LAAGVKETFMHALINAERLILAQQAVDATAALVSELEERKNTSDAQRLDLNVARIQEARARRDLAGAARARDAATAQIRRLTGMAPEQELELVGSPRTEVRALPATPDLVDRALRQRPDLLASQHDLRRSDSQVALAKRQAIPNVTLSGTL